MMRPEYPRPSLVREKWRNLNGEWDFLIDNGCSGKERRFYENADFNMKINVPFAPETKLSGIENTDFIIAYNEYKGRAYEFCKQAKNKGVTIIELAEKE